MNFKVSMLASGTTLLLLGTLACGSKEEEANKVIDRAAAPESPFTPTDLENTIDDLVDAISKTKAKSLQLGVVLKTLNAYWEPVNVGASRALSELDVPQEVVAPTEDTEEERTARQIKILKAQQDEGYDGIGIAPMASDLNEEIDKAVEAGIPVVTMDSDLPDSKRQMYIGTMNKEAGETAANTLLDLMKAKEGTVILLGHDQKDDWPDGYNRTMGAKDVLKDAGFAVVIRRSTWTDTGEAEDVASLKQSLLEADPPAVGMIGLFSNAYRNAMAAEEAEMTAADLTLVAFDFDPKTLEYMESGLIKATHVQRQYYMGYLIPYVLYGFDALGVKKTKSILDAHMVDGERFNAGLDVVKATQIEDYNDFLDSLGIGG
ncbi:MAG: substrate-binding domain-containing protein [Polyangiaceae bacterium]|nr:substrate-binding domain-containing protein [Polyangiaceae bacterium]